MGAQKASGIRMPAEPVGDSPRRCGGGCDLKEAKAVFIVPNLLKGGFFFGGAGGNGVLLVRDQETGSWSDPAFYTVAAGSFGLQFGAHASEMVLLVMTKRGVESMLKTNLKLGLEANIAAGTLGGGIEGGLTLLSVDLLAFSRSRGIFAGLSLGAGIMVTRNAWNEAYYGTSVTQQDILVNRTVHNPYSFGLRKRLTIATGGVWRTNERDENISMKDAGAQQPHACVQSVVPDEKRAEKMCRLPIPQAVGAGQRGSQS